MPMPVRIWNPIDVALGLVAVSVVRRPCPTRSRAQPNHIGGRYRFVAVIIAPATIVVGATVKATPKTNVPARMGEARVQAW